MGSFVGERAVTSLPRAFAVFTCLMSAALGTGCRRDTVATAAGAAVLPVLRADSNGLLLTWIDDKGDFHVETRVADVPDAGHDLVRVVDPNKETPSGDQVFVADFGQRGPDGTFPVRTMARSDFEAIAVSRRARSGLTMASASAAPGAVPAGSGEGPGMATQAPRTVVVIYGAEWCGACHDAARYLRRKGIPYVEKDIEKDPGAAREMEAKLSKNGLRGGSIPVMDVRGTIMVGFDPERVEAALRAAPL
jgi:glutaredoxin